MTLVTKCDKDFYKLLRNFQHYQTALKGENIGDSSKMADYANSSVDIIGTIIGEGAISRFLLSEDIKDMPGYEEYVGALRKACVNGPSGKIRE